MSSRLHVVLALSLFALACSTKTNKTPTSVEVPAAPVPSVLLPPDKPRVVLVDAVGRPLSFAPLVERADPSVAIVNAIVRGTAANGHLGTLQEGLGTAFVYDPDGYL